MKRIIVISAMLVMCFAAYSQPQLYLGIRGGAGAAMSNEQLNRIATAEGFKDATFRNTGWSATAKGEALVGLGKHFRFGYRFLYNHSYVNAPIVDYVPVTDPDRVTTYFNSSRMHMFAHYGVIEIPIINSKHFALTPGIAAGGFTGFRVDRDSENSVDFDRVSKTRFTFGAELNAEVKFGRWSLVMGPSYYLYNQQDKINNDWHRYTHVIGGDIGLRVNLLKP